MQPAIWPILATIATGPLLALATLVPFLLLVVIDLALIRYCLDDLNGRAIVVGGDRRWWTAVIIVGGPLGQALYWLYGRGPY